MERVYCILLLVFIVGCSDRVETLLIEDDSVIVKAPVNKENEWNGLVKFYSADTKALLGEASYVSGELQGKEIQYFSNGKVKAVNFYNNALLDGLSYFYDTTGSLRGTKFYYNGLGVAHLTEYRGAKIDNYRFINFEGRSIYRIYYDSIEYKRILELEPEVFFYNFRDASKYSEHDQLEDARMCFLYLPSPPKFKFDYSLAYVDQGYKEVEVIDSLESSVPWIDFVVPVDKGPEQRVALKLEVFDSTKGVWLTAFKLVNQTSK